MQATIKQHAWSMVASCLAYQFFFCFYFIMPFAWFKFFTVTRLLYLASWEWFYTVIVAEIDPKLWSYPVIAGLPQARAWGQAGDAEMWFASQCPARHFSRCFVAYSFEIRPHNFPRKDNKHGKTSFSQGRMYNEVWGGGLYCSLLQLLRLLQKLSSDIWREASSWATRT